jgi:SAM-dependent methyltransferase
MTADFRRFEHQGWERAARAYAGSFTAVTGQVAGPLLDACLGSNSTPARIVDVATGPGTVVALAASRGSRAVGIDFSGEMLALARSQPGVSFVRGDADALPFGAGTFDAATCNFGLLHFAHPEQATSEMARVVRRGGRVAVSVWSPPDRNLFFGAIYRALERHAPLRPFVPAGPPFFQYAEPARMKALLEGAGLRAGELERVAFQAAIASPTALLDLFLEGSVRTAAILRAQDASSRAKILESVTLELEPHRSGDGLLVPVEAVIGVGTKG